MIEWIPSSAWRTNSKQQSKNSWPRCGASPDERRWKRFRECGRVRLLQFEGARDVLLARTKHHEGRVESAIPGSSKPSSRSSKLEGAIKRKPGQRIEQIAVELRTRTKELALPAKKLIAAKKIRTTGNRRATKYYPK